MISKHRHIKALGAAVAVAGLTSVGALTAGCSEREPSPARLDVATSSTPPETEEEWLRKQQRVRYTYTPVSTGVTSSGDATAYSLLPDVQNACSYLIVDFSTNVCLQQLATARRRLCQARSLLALASPHSSPIELKNSFYTTAIQEVTEPFAADAASYAAKIASKVSSEALNTLNSSPSTACRDASGFWPRDGADSSALSFAAVAVDAYYLARSAYDRAIEANVNAADKLASVSTSDQLSLGRSISSSVLSRAAAAHLLVGGDPGILGSINQPFCVGPELTPQARSAVKLLRDSGISPGSLSGSTDMSTLLNIGTDSVRQRLGDFYNLDTLKTGGAGAIESYYNLTKPDFDAARNYLNQEFNAFGRSPSATMPPMGTATQRRYTGVFDKPRSLPKGAWGARARYAAQPPPYYDMGTGVWNYVWDEEEDQPLPGMDTLVASTHIRIRQMAGTTTSFAGVGDNATVQAAVKQQVMGTLSSILTSKEYQGTVELVSSSTALSAYAHGFTTADKVRVTVGEDGLRCAVQGSIEGASCADPATPPAYPCAAGTSPSLSCLTVYTLPREVAVPVFGEKGYVTTATSTPSISAANITTLRTSKTRLYFVRLKDASLAEKPGNFELLGSAIIPGGEGFSTAMPIVPNVQNRVADILAPNRDYCAVQETDCTGIATDGKIPLENELTDDNNGVESSWRHYLALADQAARESDLAGAELRAAVQRQLEGEAASDLRQEDQDQRAEDALNEIQSACGTAIDPAMLLSALSAPGKSDLALLYSGQACSVSTPCATPGTTCLAGICTTDYTALLAKYPNMPDVVRLKDCLDETAAATAPFVTLGDKRMCVYVSNGNPNDVCPPAASPCPALKTAATCPPISGVTPYDAEPLSFYKDPRAANSTPGACELIRKLRNSHGQTELDQLIATNALHPARLKDRVGELGFVAKYGGYVSITEDGTERWSTGDIVSGPVAGWPATVSAAGCPATPTGGLFCTKATTVLERAALNSRLFQATFAAQWLLNGNEPYGVYPAFGASKCTASSKDTIYEGGSNPIRVCQSGSTTTYEYLSGASNAWYYPSGTAIPAPLNFVSVKPGRARIQNYFGVGTYYGVFEGLSWVPSYNIHNSSTAWVRAALLGNTRENGKVAYLLKPDAAATFGTVNKTPDTIDSLAFVDALELLCELSESHMSTTAQQPASLSTLEDVDRAGSYLRSLGDAVTAQAASTIFARVPRIAAEALGDAAPTGTFPALSGRMGVEVTNLREAFVAARAALPVIGGAIEQMGAEMQALRAKLDQVDLESQMIDWKLLSTSLDRANACAQSVRLSTMVDSFGAGTVSECANAVAQIGIAMRMSSLQKRSNNDTAEIARAGFAERVSQLTQSIQTATLGLQDAIERVNGALSAIEGLRKQARLAVAKAIHIGSYQSAKQVATNDAAGAMSALAQKRYEKALGNAKRMAYIAKRSIEERLGVRLSEMRDALPLVDAPSKWEGTLCSLGGTDTLAENFPGSIEAGSASGKNITRFGDAFIGDYVKNLSNLVESYSLVYNFHEGDDVAIVSLRDDVKNIHAKCAVPGRNLLRSAAELTSDAWSPMGCSASPAQNCVAALPIFLGAGNNSPEYALPGTSMNVSGAAGYNLIFGDGKTCAGGAAGACTWQAGAALSQVVTLTPGRYRFSWYSKDTLAAGAARSNVVKLRANPNLALVPSTQCFGACGTQTSCAAGCFSDGIAGSGTTWKRYSLEFTVSTTGDYEVGFGVDDATRPPNTWTVAAPMLERALDNRATQISGFQATDGDTTINFNDCEDTDGEQFRAQAWRRECTHLCDTGFSANCTTGTEYCYQELTFGVSQPWIQNGKLFKFSGFARGNFNYRIDKVALNFVGSGVRNCEDSANPSTCFNAGFVPYSIEHNGPFFVRNQAGADFESTLFDGRIEHARGLALERYLTNPLSSTDRELLQDYMRKEFQGRPLDGTFVVRIWEEPGVDLHAIQDVQLVLNYHYWTRFD